MKPRTTQVRRAAVLVEWLNAKDSKDRADRERIGSIVEKLTALRPAQKRFRREVIDGEPLWLGVPEGAEYEKTGPQSYLITFRPPIAERWASELHLLNQSIKDCFARPRFHLPMEDGWKVVWETDSDFGKRLMWVINSAGLIARVRRCSNCKKWFLASRLNQVSCGQRCRKEKYASSEKGKALTKKRMKKYMRERRKKEKR